MISLIVTIIVMILLASMAIGTGTKYLRESKNKDKEVFISVLSSAVSRRQEDTNINSLSYPYLGYYINDSVVFERIFAPKVKENIVYEDGIWYVVDTVTAAGLGVREPEQYINTINKGSAEKITVALVNYVTGDVYLIDSTGSELGSFDITEDTIVSGHTHRYLISEPTCTEPVRCEDCGFILKEPLGHKYDASDSPSPVSGDEENAHYNKVCIVCGMQGGFEAHVNQYQHIDESGVWYHQMQCTVCGHSSETRVKCTLQYTLPEAIAAREAEHIKKCRYCGYSETEDHDSGYRRISESMHELYCKTVGCNHVILKEYHEDLDNNEICDLCGSVIVSYTYPQLGIVSITNKSATTEAGKYIAKYGDTIQLVIVADKPIKNLTVLIANQAVPVGNMTTTDNKTWTIELKLEEAMNIPNGNISISINCESSGGVAMLSPVTNPTDGKNVVFDGTPPIIDYIDKDERADEE